MPDISLTTLSDACASIVAGASASLVSVHAGRTRASGFVWQPGFIVTAEEALPEEGDLSVVLPGGEELAGQIVGRDPSTAIALLKIDRTDLPAVALANATVAPGALALAIGSVEGAPLAALCAVALATGPWRSLRGGEIAQRIELDLRLRDRAIGGVAVSARGAAFGMLVAGPRRRTLVIPTETIARVAPVLRDRGRIPRGYLGLGLQRVSVEGSSVGAMVISIDRDGPGAAAGVRQGDVILAIDGVGAGDVRSVVRSLGAESVGRSVRVSLRRGGEPLELALTIAERPT